MRDERESRPGDNGAAITNTGGRSQAILPSATDNHTDRPAWMSDGQWQDELRYEALQDLTRRDLPAAIALLEKGRYCIKVPDLGPDQSDAVAGRVIAHKDRKGRFYTWATIPREQTDSAAFREAREMLGLDDEADIVHWLLLDPARYLMDYGRYSGRCAICGRRLTDPETSARGIGPECVRKVPSLQARVGGEPQ